MRERGSVQPAAINSAAASLVHLVAEKKGKFIPDGNRVSNTTNFTNKIKKDFQTGLHPALVFSC